MHFVILFNIVNLEMFFRFKLGIFIFLFYSKSQPAKYLIIKKIKHFPRKKSIKSYYFS